MNVCPTHFCRWRAVLSLGTRRLQAGLPRCGVPPQLPLHSVRRRRALPRLVRTSHLTEVLVRSRPGIGAVVDKASVRPPLKVLPSRRLGFPEIKLRARSASPGWIGRGGAGRAKVHTASLPQDRVVTLLTNPRSVCHLISSSTRGSPLGHHPQGRLRQVRSPRADLRPNLQLAARRYPGRSDMLRSRSTATSARIYHEDGPTARSLDRTPEHRRIRYPCCPRWRVAPAGRQLTPPLLHRYESPMPQTTRT